MDRFRTEIDARPAPFDISHDHAIVMLGSCFTDNVGALLRRDGFNVTHNPMGPLYNPASLLRAIALALGIGNPTIIKDDNGAWHCLDFASRYSDPDRQRLIEKTNADLQALGDAIRTSSSLILTLGTSFVFSLADGPIVGNCHKFPAQTFTRRRLSTEENTQCLRKIISILPANIKHVIFTVSPIRHVGDGLHANQLSKAALLLAIDQTIAENDIANYFPAYELIIDDLRDYRFYAADMKHPSDVAVEYIYDKFAQTYFSPATAATAIAARKQSLRAAHRPINSTFASES